MAIPPAGRAAWQCLRLKDPAGDRPGQRIGADGAKLREFVDGIAEGSAPGRGGEYRVAVEGRVRARDTVCQSKSRCAVRLGRAHPSCATIANSSAGALLRAASVATRARVVFSPGRPFAFGVRAADGTVTGKPRPPNSPSTSNGAAQ